MPHLKTLTLDAVILAAGQGSRIGEAKALLEFKSQSFLAHVAGAITNSGCFANITVVTGFYAENVETEATKLGLKTVRNPEPNLGLLSSLQAGLSALPETADGAAIFLVDQPLISAEMIRSFIDAFVEAGHKTGGRYTLARPLFDGRPGHPSVILRQHFKAVLDRMPGDVGASFLFNENKHHVFGFHVTNADFVFDVDTKDDFKRLNS